MCVSRGHSLEKELQVSLSNIRKKKKKRKEETPYPFLKAVEKETLPHELPTKAGAKNPLFSGLCRFACFVM